MAITISLVEDDLEMAHTITAFLNKSDNIKVHKHYQSVEDFLEKAPSKTNNLILLDIGLPGISGLEGIKKIKEKHKKLKIVMLTSYEDSDRIFKALCAGANSYISKRTPLVKIKEAIYAIERGGAFMSPEIAKKVVEYFNPKPANKLSTRELDIVKGLADGLSYKMIANKYQISVETVREYIKRMYKKLHVNSRTEVISRYLKGEIN